MSPFLFFIIFLFFCLVLGYITLYLFDWKISQKEARIIALFQKRNDTIPALYEIEKAYFPQFQEIFQEILELRKQEFHISEITKKLETFIELEKKMHHELNFIFQISNKNPRLLREKRFLYLRDIILDISLSLSREIQIYRKIIYYYNKGISYKNRSVIGYFLPFEKKPIL